MVPLIQRIVNAFLWDEDMGPRWLAMLLASIGGILATGGNVPGTAIVVPGVADFQFLGPWMLLGSFAIVSVTTAMPKTKTEVAAPPGEVVDLSKLPDEQRAKVRAIVTGAEKPKP